MDKSFSVRVEPSGIVFEVRPKETVFAAAVRSGLHWPTICYGQVRCTACALKIVDGRQNVIEPTPAETVVLRRMAESGGRRRPDREMRLACQLRLTGDITARKSGVRLAVADDAAQPHPTVAGDCS